MTIAALDFGRRRIGVAVADIDGLVVRPVDTIERKSVSKDLQRIKALCDSLEVTQIVLGLPLNMDGTSGPQAKLVEDFAKHLREATGLPVELFDERLTSFEAEQRLRSIPPSRRTRNNSIDAVAASVIMESWFQARRHPR